MLFPLIFVLAGVPQLEQVDTARFRVSLPGTLSAPIDGVELTPWGEAITLNYSSDYQGCFRYTFTTYKLKKQGTLSLIKLRELKRYLLKNRECVAKESKRVLLKDSEGIIWPQLYLSGRCVADEGFRTLHLIAKKYLYRFSVPYECSIPPSPADPINSIDSAPPPSPPPPPAEKLDQAIRDFVASSQFKSLKELDQ